MAEYFETKREAKEFVQECYAEDRKLPVFFGKIFNNGEEKWIVNYDARQNPRASPHIKVLEDHSREIRITSFLRHWFGSKWWSRS
jgi:hypothetical protein